MSEYADDEPDYEPPPSGRVVDRLACLVAVGFRGLFEADGPEAEPSRAEVIAWVDDVGASEELEPEERRLLATPIGELTPQETVNASWRFEGVAILGHALGLWELPSYDVVMEVGDVASTLGLPDAEAGREVLARARLAAPEALDLLRHQHFALHWRLRDFSLRPRSMDFVEFASTAWFGPLPITPARIAADRDLDIGGRPILDADPADRSRTSSILAERHLATNWLARGGLYSETDAST